MIGKTIQKNRQLNVFIPLRLRVYFALRNTNYISQTCQHEHQLVVPDHRECEITPAEQRGPARSLHAIERTADQNIIAVRENIGSFLEQALPSERRPRQIEIENRISKLRFDIDTHCKCSNALKGAGDKKQANDIEIVNKFCATEGAAELTGVIP